MNCRQYHITVVLFIFEPPLSDLQLTDVCKSPLILIFISYCSVEYVHINIMSYTFVKTKDEPTFNKWVLEEMFEKASEEAKSKVEELPDDLEGNETEILDKLYELITLTTDKKRN